jgi:hypothetical protein
MLQRAATIADFWRFLAPGIHSAQPPLTIGAHQQTGQRTASLSSGGSSAGHGTQSAAMAQQVLTPCHAARAEDREGGDGPQAGGLSVLDVAAGPRLRPAAKVRFARGTARKSRWCAVITDVMIGHPAPSTEGVRTSNHDRSWVIEEIAGSG